MNREIKFRAYQDNQMLIQAGAGNYSLMRFIGFLYEDTPIMQYTGLKDKNGKEIYEGDIVTCIDNPTDIFSVIGKVYFKKGRWMIACSMIPLGDYGESWTEVVGNIHENPELLK